jgi:hypothetical protein
MLYIDVLHSIADLHYRALITFQEYHYDKEHYTTEENMTYMPPHQWLPCHH